MKGWIRVSRQSKVLNLALKPGVVFTVKIKVFKTGFRFQDGISFSIKANK